MKKLCLVGYKIGIVTTPPQDKVQCLTTELAHRTNSFGLPHILEYENEDNSSDNKR